MAMGTVFIVPRLSVAGQNLIQTQPCGTLEVKIRDARDAERLFFCVT